jgi:hypothetical protein
VKFPGKCETTVTEQDDVTTTKSQLTVGEEVYFFSTSVHENPLVDYADMAEISREAFGRSLNADLVSASETDFQGHISNQAEFILANQEMKISYCVFFIDQIQFQMIYMAPIHSFNENHKDKFFNSFRGKK